MNRVLGLIFGCIFLIASPLYADTIHLKDGRVLTGEIKEKGAYYVIFKEGNVLHKFYDGEIAKIEEDTKEQQPPAEIKDMDVSQEEAKLIRKLIEVNGTRYTMEANLQKVIKQSPLAKQREIKKVFDVDEVIDALLPLYAKYYTVEDLKEIIKFYESPAGQKLKEVTPKIMKESIDSLVGYVYQHM